MKTLLIAVLMTISLVACSKKEEPQVVDAQQPPTQDTFKYTDGFAALLRAYKLDTVCYDEPRNAYFVHFPESESSDDKWQGWYYFDDFTFHYLKANNTWFLADNKQTFTKVWPNVDGMPCAKATDPLNK